MSGAWKSLVSIARRIRRSLGPNLLQLSVAIRSLIVATQSQQMFNMHDRLRRYLHANHERCGGGSTISSQIYGCLAQSAMQFILFFTAHSRMPFIPVGRLAASRWHQTLLILATWQ
jgi:hypothetical protein